MADSLKQLRLLLETLPSQAEQSFAFSLYFRKDNTKSPIMETASATLRQYSRRGGPVVGPNKNNKSLSDADI